ncbi:MAG: sodium:solute symporter family protein [Kiritimatiellia bacterium]
MTVAPIDWAIIIGFLVAVILIGSTPAIIGKIRNKGDSASDFFLSGRSMPWWLLGVSMVACTFSCDTPNLVTDMVRNGGVAKNWGWWAFLLTGMLTVFVYAKLWRRSELNTDLGFYEIRYSGKPAAILRGFRSLYLGIFFNVLIMATVSLAAIKIGQVMFDLSPVQSLVFASVGVAIYATLGGLTGSIWADFFQYSVAMVGAFFAAYYAVMSEDVGHVSSFTALLEDSMVQAQLAFFPPVNGAVAGEPANYSNFVTLLILPIAVQWWNVWYPGAEPGGGGYIAQRMLSAKDEKNAIGATLLFNFLHYAVRPWPWIVVALVSITQFPMDAQKRAHDYTKENSALVQEYVANPEAFTVKNAKEAELIREHLLAVKYPEQMAAKEYLKSLGKEQKDKIDNFVKVNQTAVNAALASLNPTIDPSMNAAIRYERARLAADNLVGMRVAFADVDRQYLRHDMAYPGMISKMPKGWLGLIVASLVAAYMSTIATHLNWGSSYFVQDFWVRFINKDTTPKTAVFIGRICMLSLLVLSALVALCMQNAMDSFNILLQVGAGTGLLYILRWFWWRINAWSEISAMIVSFLVAIFFKFCGAATGIEELLSSDAAKRIMDYSSWQLVIGIILTTITWVSVTYLTKPEKDEILISFCKKIRAGGPGWKRFEGRLDGISATEWDMPLAIVCMVLGCFAVWTALFGIGLMVYLNFVTGGILLGLAIVATIVLMKLVGKVKLS